MYYLGNLIRRYINVDEEPERIAELLNLKTCEVEKIKKRVLPDGVVIAKVEKVEKHPNADKLFIVILNVGKYGECQVVTGGENIINAIKKYVPLCLPNTYLPAIDLEVITRQVRGIVSQGMICSKYEIGVPEDEDKHWIWVLDEDFDDLTDEDVGKSMKEKYPWLENWILDVDNKTITHRPDLFGHFGLGWEFQSIFFVLHRNKIRYSKLSQIKANFDNTNILELLSTTNKSSKSLKVETEGCNTYILLQLNDVNVKKSDFYVRTLMYDMGLNPKNNWVDFSNIFMFLTGHPIHFFDADKVKGDIIVRKARNGEEFIDLLGNLHKLTAEDIVIADEEKVLALAGIIGGSNSAVDKNTRNILVEIANFDSVKLRKTALRLGLRTDAELRFEKNINFLWSLYVLLLFLDELKFFRKTLGIFDIKGLQYYISPDLNISFKQTEVDMEDMINFIMGTESAIGNNKKKEEFVNVVDKILVNLGFDIEKNNKKLKIKIPLWRGLGDVKICEDIYEEVARIWGYEKIQSQPVISKIKYVPYNTFVDFNQKLEDIFVRDFGFTQIEFYPWLDESLIRKLQIRLEEDKLIKILNPLSSETKYLRNTLLFDFLRVVEKNFRVKDYIKIFEIDKIWYKNEIQRKFDYIENLRNFNSDKIPSNLIEKTKIGFAIYKSKVGSWQDDVLIEGKGYINALLDRLNIDSKLEYKKEDILYKNLFHPKRYGSIYLDGQNIGFVGMLHSIWYDVFKFLGNSQFVYFELDFNSMLNIFLKQIKLKQGKYDTLTDQIIWKDLSFVIGIDDSYEKIIDIVKTIEEVEDVIVFDIYKGPNLPSNKKSISLSVKIKGYGLTSDDINRILDKIIKEVEKVGGKLR